MEKEILAKQIGLDQKASCIYLTLLESGRASMTELAKKASLKRPTAYLVLEELLLLGLVTQTKIAKRKVYTAVHPRRLTEIAKERIQNLEEVIPEMVALYNSPKDRPKIQVFEGKEGVMAVYREVYQALSNQEEALWFTNMEALSRLKESTEFYKKMLIKLDNPRIRELNLGNEAGIRWSNEIKPLQGVNHHIRLLPPDFEFGLTDTLIFGDKFVTFSLKKDIFVAIIESVDIAKSYRAMFEWAWKAGREF